MLTPSNYEAIFKAMGAPMPNCFKFEPGADLNALHVFDNVIIPATTIQEAEPIAALKRAELVSECRGCPFNSYQNLLPVRQSLNNPSGLNVCESGALIVSTVGAKGLHEFTSQEAGGEVLFSFVRKTGISPKRLMENYLKAISSPDAIKYAFAPVDP